MRCARSSIASHKANLHSLIHKQTENKLEKPVTARGFEIRHD